MLFNKLFYSSPLAGASAPTYTISGTVYDADGSTAVASATIALGAYSTTSAANGTYTISDVPAGTSGSMTCTKTGYSWTAKTIAAMSGNLTAQNYTNAWYAVEGNLANVRVACMAKGAASYAASIVNLANPGTNDLLPRAEGAPNWDSTNGWQSASTVRYLRMGYNGYSHSHTAIVRFSSANAGNSPLGALSPLVLYYPNAAADKQSWYCDDASTLKQISGAVTSGTGGFAGDKGVYNGVVRTTAFGALTSPAEFYIGSTPAGQFTGYVQAFVFYTTVLGTTALAMLHTAMTNL